MFESTGLSRTLSGVSTITLLSENKVVYHNTITITYKSISNGDFEPHAVPDLQARFCVGHGLHNSSHVSAYGQVEVIKAWG